MIEFLNNPNLPDNDVVSVICASEDEDVLKFFEESYIEVIPCEANLCVDPSIKNHTDIMALHIGENNIVIDKQQTKLNKKLTDIGMNTLFTKEPVAGEYPDDVKLNFTVIGKDVVGNFRYADDILSEVLKNFDKTSVKQGYCKCSVLVISEKAVITDDQSIYRNLAEKGFDCLLISKGDVFLDGHEYGFIGGASGKISKEKVVFFGDITKHRDFDKIRTFLYAHNCSFVCSDKNKLRDIGGFVPLMQNLNE
ncbi:MAG: hypothetical protein U0L11_02950 [Acutalibacteraceae bacterium]|nr:hypothetical protein [Acutalibacteraceae bacterium]